MNYKTALQVRRQDNMRDAGTIAQLQIAQVPGVSVSNAQEILKTFNVTTLARLARMLCALPDKPSRLKALMSVPKIGKKKADLILELLFSEEDDNI